MNTTCLIGHVVWIDDGSFPSGEPEHATATPAITNNAVAAAASVPAWPTCLAPPLVSLMGAAGPPTGPPHPPANAGTDRTSSPSAAAVDPAAAAAARSRRRT